MYRVLEGTTKHFTPEQQQAFLDMAFDKHWTSKRSYRSLCRLVRGRILDLKADSAKEPILRGAVLQAQYADSSS